MRIALVGHGRMGREIEVQARDLGHAVCCVADSHAELEAADLSGAEVAIEFTAPDQAVRNIGLLAARGVPTVVGTTGWYDCLPEVRALISDHGTGLLYSPNFSIGVQLFFRIVEHAASLFGGFAEYDVLGHERHHASKADAPSGTALHLAELLLAAVPRKTTLVVDLPGRPLVPEELHFSSARGGHDPGTHTVTFDGPADRIELTHSAKSRAGFARGALAAAEWLCGRRGVFTMDDFLADRLGLPTSRM